MSQNGVQIGVAGSAYAKGIPGATLSWTGPNGTVRSVTIYNSFRKQPFAEKSDSHGNRGEWQASRTRNRGYRIAVESKPIGAKESDARTIAADLPHLNTLASISGATDASINTASPLGAPGAAPDYIVESAETSYTPENDTIVTMTLMVYLNDDNSHVVPVVLADS